MILGDDPTASTSRLTLNAQVGVTGAYDGLKQLLDSAVSLADGDTGGFANTSTSYLQTRSATTTAKGFALNVKCVCTADDAQNPLSIGNLNAAITISNIEGGKQANRIFLVSERRMDRITDLLSPQGRYVIGANSVELDGGQRVLTWRGHKIISSRLMALYGPGTGNGSALTRTDTDVGVLFLDMDNINFYNVAGVDARHVPIMGADASQRSDVEGGYFKTYGIFIVEKFNTQVVIYNLTTP